MKDFESTLPEVVIHCVWCVRWIGPLIIATKTYYQPTDLLILPIGVNSPYLLLV